MSIAAAQDLRDKPQRGKEAYEEARRNTKAYAIALELGSIVSQNSVINFSADNGGTIQYVESLEKYDGIAKFKYSHVNGTNDEILSSKAYSKSVEDIVDKTSGMLFSPKVRRMLQLMGFRLFEPSKSVFSPNYQDRCLGHHHQTETFLNLEDLIAKFRLWNPGRRNN